jgi:uncharacterized protein
MLLRLPEESVTPQERELLTQLTQRINQTRLEEKDPDAENLLGRELGTNPDAVYILSQTVLVQDIALQQARAQVSQLQQELEHARQQQQQPQHSTSFLGRLLGDRDPQPAYGGQPQAPPPQQWQQGSQQQPPFQPVPYAPQQPSYGGQPPYGAPQYGSPYAPPMYPTATGQPSFLRGAMQTAAGVAAGALAFEGVESILHGFGHGGGLGMAGVGMSPGMGMGGAFERPVEETVINNYYEEPGAGGHPGSHGEGEHHAFQGDNQSDNLRGFDDTSPQDHAGHNFASNDQAGSQNYTGPDEMALDDGQGPGYTLDDTGQDEDLAQDDGGLDDGGGFGDDGSFDNSDSGF